MTAALPIPRPAADPNAWQLVERAQAGDRDAFAEIYRANHSVVFRFVQSRVGNRQTAEDLTQDVFLRAMKNIGNVRWQGSDVAAWLITIAKHRVVDHLRYVRRYPVAYGGPVVESAEGREQVDRFADERVDSDPMSDPANSTVAYLTNLALLAALKSLPSDEQQRVIILRFLRGLSVLETAEVMGKTDAAVKAMTHRATQSLGRDPRVQELGVAA